MGTPPSQADPDETLRSDAKQIQHLIGVVFPPTEHAITDLNVLAQFSVVRKLCGEHADTEPQQSINDVRHLIHELIVYHQELFNEREACAICQRATQQGNRSAYFNGVLAIIGVRIRFMTGSSQFAIRLQVPDIVEAIEHGEITENREFLYRHTNYRHYNLIQEAIQDPLTRTTLMNLKISIGSYDMNDFIRRRLAQAMDQLAAHMQPNDPVLSAAMQRTGILEPGTPPRPMPALQHVYPPAIQPVQHNPLVPRAPHRHTRPLGRLLLGGIMIVALLAVLGVGAFITKAIPPFQGSNRTTAQPTGLLGTRFAPIAPVASPSQQLMLLATLQPDGTKSIEILDLLQQHLYPLWPDAGGQLWMTWLAQLPGGDGAIVTYAYAPATHQLAFAVHDASGHTSIWVGILSLDPNARPQLLTEPSQLLMDCGGCSTLNWAPDGSRLLFNSHLGLHAVDIADGLLHTISVAANDAFPSCAPDGQHLAYEAANGEITVLATNDCLPTSDSGYLHTPGFTISWGPVWTADSQWIYFTSTQATGRGQIYRVRLDQLIADSQLTPAATQAVIANPLTCIDPALIEKDKHGQPLLVFICADRLGSTGRYLLAEVGQPTGTLTNPVGFLLSMPCYLPQWVPPLG